MLGVLLKMKTIKPLSTISYNSDIFLKEKLKELCANGVIDFWYYIKHIGEYDKITKLKDKDHIHLYLEPCERVNTVELKKVFDEYAGDDYTKEPLKCMPFRTSKPYDCLLYNLHNEQYLSMKMEEKEFHYSLSDVVTNDIDYFNNLYSEAMHSDIFKNQRLIELLNNGNRISDLAYNGFIKPQQAYAYSVFEDLYNQGKFNKVADNEKNRVLDLDNPFKE